MFRKAHMTFKPSERKKGGLIDGVKRWEEFDERPMGSSKHYK
jgi:hypothetical protein